MNLANFSWTKLCAHETFPPGQVRIHVSGAVFKLGQEPTQVVSKSTVGQCAQADTRARCNTRQREKQKGGAHLCVCIFSVQIEREKKKKRTTSALVPQDKKSGPCANQNKWKRISKRERPQFDGNPRRDKFTLHECETKSHSRDESTVTFSKRRKISSF